MLLDTLGDVCTCPVIFSICKFYICGWWGGQEFQSKTLLTTFLRTLHACVVTSTSQEHCITFRTHSNSKTRVTNSACYSMVVLALSHQDTSQLPECTCYSKSVPRAVYWNCDCRSLCVVQLQFWLQTVGCMVCTGCGSANYCLTCRSVLYAKAGAYYFVVPCQPNVPAMGQWCFGRQSCLELQWKRHDFSRACLVMTTTLGTTVYAVVSIECNQ